MLFTIPLRRLALSVPRVARPVAIPRRQVGRTFVCTPARRHDIPKELKESKVYNFEEIEKLASSPEPSRLIIDVREPGEFEAGHIPGAINLPIASAPEALSLDPTEFEDRFGFKKPEPSKELVFYCKAGVRSSAAAGLAKQWGYEKVGEYRGSWNDWTAKGGVVKK